MTGQHVFFGAEQTAVGTELHLGLTERSVREKRNCGLLHPISHSRQSAQPLSGAMPATPAWPPKSLPRLFVRQALGEGDAVDLDAAQANYLGNVMRLGAGAELLVFDGSSGEWLARIVEAGKKRMTLRVERETREPETIPDVWLAFAPVKRAQTDWLVEKATELGAARLIPVMTQRTVAERVRLDRLKAIAIEAAEQCGRTRLPQIAEPVALEQLLDQRDPARRLYFADERWRRAGCGAFKPGPAADPRRAGGRLYRRGARDRSASSRTRGHLARAADSSRGNSRACGACSYMAIAGDWRDRPLIGP